MTVFERFRPSPALVVASLALLVALAGTSVAAVSVTLPRNSVGNAQLRNNAVTSIKVANRSLRSVDFARGQIPPGPRGAQGPVGPSGPAGPQGPAGAAAPGYVAQVVSQTGATASTTSSTGWIDLPGSTQQITVPTGETARFYAWFSAESACYGGAGNATCGVHITLDGAEMQPQVDEDFAFDSTDAGDESSSSWESHSIVRVSETIAAGPHTIKVQFRTSQASTTLRLDDWALVIQRTKIS